MLSCGAADLVGILNYLVATGVQKDLLKRGSLVDYESGKFVLWQSIILAFFLHGGSVCLWFHVILNSLTICSLCKFCVNPLTVNQCQIAHKTCSEFL